MNKILLTTVILIMLGSSVIAGTDDENKLSNKPVVVKDCFEGLNRATFALNQSLDSAIFFLFSKA